MANLGESKVWCQNNETNSSVSETCSTFPGVGGIWPEKNRVWIAILALLLSVLLLITFEKQLTDCMV